MESYIEKEDKRYLHFQLHDFVVFFLLCLRTKTLPGKFAFQKVEEDIA